MCLDDLTTTQAMRLRSRMLERVTFLPNGCIVAAPGAAGVLTLPNGHHVTYSRIAWLLRHKEPPKFRLRTTCRMVGCCNADHLYDAPPRIHIKGDPSKRLSQSERAHALDLYFNHRMRLQDIGDVVGVSAQSVHRLVTKVRGLS